MENIIYRYFKCKNQSSNLFIFSSSILLALLLFESSALAYCTAPTMYDDPPSSPSSYGRPSAPFCLSSYQFSRTHTCSSWEIENYISEINDYIHELSTYAEQARSFADSAIDFANEATRYANCESSDVKSEIE